jgi:hypothetical protein
MPSATATWAVGWNSTVKAMLPRWSAANFCALVPTTSMLTSEGASPALASALKVHQFSPSCSPPVPKNLPLRSPSDLISGRPTRNQSGRSAGEEITAKPLAPCATAASRASGCAPASCTSPATRSWIDCGDDWKITTSGAKPSSLKKPFSIATSMSQ